MVLEAPEPAGFGVPLGAGWAGTVPPGLAGVLTGAPIVPPAGFCETPGAGVGDTVAPLGDGTGAVLVGRVLLGAFTGAWVVWAMAAAGTRARPAMRAIDLIIRKFSVRFEAFEQITARGWLSSLDCSSRN
ncbi:hypothetical protein IP69_16230 [Bosea sp. AAP35]|nr:hypothetical protein IP69_16230 [Bosea sp. AAP35]